MGIFVDEVLWYENYDVENIVTPMNVNALKRLLKETDYDEEKGRFLIDGFSNGFSLGYQGPTDVKILSKNHKLRAGNPTILWNKLMKEVELKRAAGPWTLENLPFDNYIQSPITLIPKKGSESSEGIDGTRLIFDLSSPRGKSVNDHTPQSVRSVEYPLFDKSVRMCLKEGVGCYVSSCDCKSAFKQLPLATDQFRWVIMMCPHPKTRVEYYFCDKTLCFGSGTSCYLYMKLSNAIAHIFRYRTSKTQGDINNYLDDFQTCKLDRLGCNRYLEIFMEICEELNLPLSKDKTQWATQIMIFLGLLINTVSQTISIPLDKVERGKKELDIMIRSKKVTVRQIQSLAGLLNFFCRAIVPGRAFTRRLYSRIAGLQQHHHVRVVQEMKDDCRVWKKFLELDEAVCRPFIDFSEVLHADQIHFYTDAALNNVRLGVGGIYENEFFAGAQQLSKSSDIGAMLNIQIAELYSIMLAINLWSGQLKNRRVVIFTDNESVMHMINQSSSSCKICMIMIRLITCWSMIHNVRFFAMHVGTKLNKSADLLSRNKLQDFRALCKSQNKQVTRCELPDDLWPIPLHWLMDKSL